MNPQELQGMLIRLTGDGTQYLNTLKKASEATQSFVGTVTGAFAVLASGAAFKGAVDMFASTETANIRLKATLKGTKEEVDAVYESYQKYAKAVYDATLASRDETAELLRQAAVRGEQGEGAMRLVSQARALAAATGHSVSTAIIALQQYEDTGADHMLKHLLRLRQVKDDTVILTKANEMMLAGQKMLEAEANSTAGVLKRYQDSLKALTKQFGETVVEAILPMVKGMTRLVKMFTDLDPATKKLIVQGVLLAAALAGLPPILSAISKILGSWGSILFSSFGLLGLAITVAGYALGQFLAKIADWDTVFQVIKNSFMLLVSAVRDGLETMYNLINSLVSPAWEALTGTVASFSQELAYLVGVVALAVIGYYAWSAAVYLVTAAYTVLNALGVFQLLSLAAQLSWVVLLKLAYVAWSIVLFAFNAGYAITIGLINACSLGLIIYDVTAGTASAATVALIGAITMLTAAWAALDVAMAPAIIIGVIAAMLTLTLVVGGLVYAVSAIAGGFMVAVSASVSFFGSVFTEVRLVTGALGGFKEVVDDLAESFGLLTRAMQVEGGAAIAWEILKTQFQITLEELKTLLPPFWGYIKAGFWALWDAVTAELERSFYQAMFNIAQRLVKLTDPIGLFSGLGQSMTDAMNEALHGARLDSLRELEKRLKEAGEAYEAAVKGADRSAINAAKERMDQLKTNLDYMEYIDAERKKKKKEDETPYKPLKRGAEEARHEIEKLEAVLYGSQKAIGEMFRQTLKLSGIDVAGVKSAAAGSAAGSTTASGSTSPTSPATATSNALDMERNNLLREISGTLKTGVVKVAVI